MSGRFQAMCKRQRCLHTIPLDSLTQFCGMCLSPAHQRRSDMNLTSTRATAVRDHHTVSAGAGRRQARLAMLSCAAPASGREATPDESGSAGELYCALRPQRTDRAASIDCRVAVARALAVKTFDATVSNVLSMRPGAQSVVSEKLCRPQRRIQRFGIQSFGRRPSRPDREASLSNLGLKTLHTPVGNVFGPSAPAERPCPRVTRKQERQMHGKAAHFATSGLHCGLQSAQIRPYRISKDFRGDAAA